VFLKVFIFTSIFENSFRRLEGINMRSTTDENSAATATEQLKSRPTDENKLQWVNSRYAKVEWDEMRYKFLGSLRRREWNNIALGKQSDYSHAAPFKKY